MDWKEVCEDKSLQDLPYKIELNRWGQVVMSPAKGRHAYFQGLLERQLVVHAPHGVICPEYPVQTADSIKAPDVVWFSPERFEQVKDEDVAPIAPEICIEVRSQSNTMDEMIFKKDLYFGAGALEFWLCNESGQIQFFDPEGPLTASRIVPGFPIQITR